MLNHVRTSSTRMLEYLHSRWASTMLRSVCSSVLKCWASSIIIQTCSLYSQTISNQTWNCGLMNLVRDLLSSVRLIWCPMFSWCSILNIYIHATNSCCDSDCLKIHEINNNNLMWSVFRKLNSSQTSYKTISLQFPGWSISNACLVLQAWYSDHVCF